MLPWIPYVAKDGCWIPLPCPCKYDKEEIFKIYFLKKFIWIPDYMLST